jgi:hypothetical protein
MNQKVLVGSRALEVYGIPVKSNSDWDFLTEKVIACDGVDSILLSFESTNKVLFDLSIKYGKTISTPFGEAILGPKVVLFVMYNAMQESLFRFDYFETRLDDLLDILKNLRSSMDDSDYGLSVNLSDDELQNIIDKRIDDNVARLQKQADNFFTKEVPRLIEHDKIHVEIAKSLGKSSPTFELIVEDDHQNKGSKDKYFSLSKDDKISLVFEEICVFAIERTLIPQMVAMPSMACSFYEDCLNTEEFYAPANYWLYMFSKKGGVKNTPGYVSEFIQQNYDEINTFVKQNWKQCFDSISQNFWEEVLRIVTKR